jgi:hypothetical protein
MWDDYPELKGLIERVLGGPIDGQASISKLEILQKDALVEIKISFRKDNIPPNFIEKNRNSLFVLLYIPNFILKIESIEDNLEKITIEKITNKSIHFYMGRYKFKFKTAKLHIMKLESVNEMNLVDDVW